MEMTQVNSYRPPVTKLIQAMIEQYNVNSLLKEFLQNADDAGATELIVTLDLRNHGEFHEPKFNVASGPALLISNNALFQEGDFKAIGEIMDGNKVEKAQSTGRFGQGFTSSFSISDHPSLMSGGILHGQSMWFDVHESAVCEGQGGAVATWHHSSLKNTFTPAFHQWLATFLAPGDDSGENRTIFRLPLRTQDTESQSKISNQVFDESHFFEWCDEWRDQSDNLLFLRNIQTLILRRIDDKGTLHTLLKVETKNHQEVTKHKHILNKALDKNLTPKQLCDYWLHNDEVLPVVTYTHKFKNEYFNRDNQRLEFTESEWIVINGLFKGENNKLLKHAKKVLSIGPNHRKVLPWAGLAIPLDRKQSISKNGKLFTFLPLDISSRSNIHINGWFELDDKRTSLTLKKGNDEQALLVEWNFLLFEHAIGIAWAELLLKSKDKLSTRSYYGLWPTMGNEAYDRSLQKGFYTKMVKSDCLMVTYQNNKHWLPPSKDKYYCSKSATTNLPSQELQDLIQSKIKLVSPEPPKRIIECLANYGQPLSVFTPEVLASLIRFSTKHFDFPLDTNALKGIFFSNKKHVSEILSYIMSSDNGQEIALGLPLEYKLDGQLHCIGPSSIFSGTPKLPAFNHDYSSFIDINVYQDLSYERPVSWLNATLYNQLCVLSEMLDSTTLNQDWLDEITKLIESSGSEQSHVYQIKRLLTSMRIFKGQNESITSLNYIHSDFHPVIEHSPDQRPYLEKLNVKLYDKEWTKSYVKLHNILGPEFSPFIKANNSFIIHKISTMDREAISELSNPEFRHFILRVIAKANITSNTNNANINRIKEDIPLVLTQTGKLVAVNSFDNLYLPGGFSSDESLSHINELYQLVHSSEEEFFDTFEKLGLGRLSFEEFVVKVIVKYLEEPNPLAKKHIAIKWLCEQISLIENDSSTVEALKRCTIIPMLNGQVAKAQDVYRPNYIKTLPLCLQETAPKLSDLKHDNFHKLLGILGASDNVKVSHFCDTAKIVAESNHIEKARTLALYAQDNISHFEGIFKQNPRAFTQLQSIAWIPCIQGQDIAQGKTPPPNKLAVASSVVVDSMKIRLCPTYHLLDPRLDVLNNKGRAPSDIHKGATFSSTFGLRTRSTIQEQIQNYDSLTNLEPTQANQSFLSRASINLFSSVGKSNLANGKILRSSDKIFIESSWVSSRSLFFRQIHGLPNLRSVSDFLGSLKRDQFNIKHGLEILGVTEKPSMPFLIEYLNRELGLRHQLSDEYYNIAKNTLIFLEEHYIKSISRYSDIPLLTTSNALYNSSQVYVDEVGEYASASEKNINLRVCFPEFNKLAGKTSAKSIKSDSVLIVNKDKTKVIPKSQVVHEDSRFIDKLKAPWFENAVRRLVFYYTTQPDTDMENDYRYLKIPDQVKMCQELTLTCTIKSVWIYDTNNRSVFESDNTLYVLYGSRRVLYEALASYVVKQLSLNNADAITIIGTLTREIDSEQEANEYLDEKNIPQLPKEREYHPICPQVDLYNFEEFDSISDVSRLNEPEQTFDTTKQDSPPAAIHNKPEEASTTAPRKNKESSKTKAHKITSNERSKMIHALEKHLGKSRNSIDDSKSLSKEYSDVRERHEVTENYDSDSENIVTSELGDIDLEAPTKTKVNFRAKADQKRQTIDVGFRDFVSNNNASTLANSFSGNQATLLGDWGEEKVIEVIRNELGLSASCSIINKARRNNPGYDLYVIDQKGNELQRIEVKTLSGPWGSRGYPLSRTQLMRAFEDPHWTLYVIFGANTGHAKLVNMGNPVLGIEKFFFPSSWNIRDEEHSAQIVPFKI
ncbi:hypothetical protein VCHA57P526_30218 [Vibrio chagasii]|nr:hypothetical protein VCHA57P526_30218 [Vibrio chagasii]